MLLFTPSLGLIGRADGTSEMIPEMHDLRRCGISVKICRYEA